MSKRRCELIPPSDAVMRGFSDRVSLKHGVETRTGAVIVADRLPRPVGFRHTERTEASEAQIVLR